MEKETRAQTLHWNKQVTGTCWERLQGESLQHEKSYPSSQACCGYLILLQTLLNPYQNCSHDIFQAEIPACVSQHQAWPPEKRALHQHGQEGQARQKQTAPLGCIFQTFALWTHHFVQPNGLLQTFPNIPSAAPVKEFLTDVPSQFQGTSHLMDPKVFQGSHGHFWMETSRQES